MKKGKEKGFSNFKLKITILSIILLIILSLIIFSIFTFQRGFTGNIVNEKAGFFLIEGIKAFFGIQTLAVEGSGSGLVGHWKFDEGTGTTASDSSGNGNTGTLTNGPTWTTDSKVGSGALEFDGVNDYVTMGAPSSLNITGAVTVSAWINPLSSGLNRNVLTKGSGAGSGSGGSQYDLVDLGSNRFRFLVSNGTASISSLTGSGGAPNNKWTHLVGVYDGVDTTQFYLNGVQVGTNTLVGFGGVLNSKGNFAIGGSGGANVFNGSIDDVRVYNRKLSASEIQELYVLGGGTLGDTTPPIISNVQASGISSSGATISWNTNENSDTQVEYGLTSSYGSQTTLNSNLVTSHSQTLSGLQAGVLYHYKVKSKDAAGNLAISGDNVFTTSSVGGGTPIASNNSSNAQQPEEPSEESGEEKTAEEVAGGQSQTGAGKRGRFIYYIIISFLLLVGLIIVIVRVLYNKRIKSI